MILTLLLACAQTLDLPDAGDLEGYTTGDIRSHRTSYCGDALEVPQVAPASVLSVVYCDSYQRDATCTADPTGSVSEQGGTLVIDCPDRYDGTGYARVYFLLME